MSNLRIVMFLHVILLAVVGVTADIIDITLTSNPAYISDELAAYLPIASSGANEPYVGFNGGDIGEGSGNGRDEVVAFSFIFAPVSAIECAYLTLELTPHGTGSDELLFSDNNSVRTYGRTCAKFYGNSLLEVLPRGVRTVVAFNLMAMDYSDPYGTFVGSEDLSGYLYDGDLNVVYADDAIIHSARLQINTGNGNNNGNGYGHGNENNGHHVPEPAMLVLLCLGCMALVLQCRVKRMRLQ